MPHKEVHPGREDSGEVFASGGRGFPEGGGEAESEGEAPAPAAPRSESAPHARRHVVRTTSARSTRSFRFSSRKCVPADSSRNTARELSESPSNASRRAAGVAAYAKRAIALEKLSGGKAAEGATKPSALVLLVEAANSYGDFGNATGERIVEPEQTADGAESAIPKEAFAGIPEAWRKTLAAAFLVIDRHAAALKGTTHDVASAKREIAAALKGKKGFHELSDTARAMLSALERYDGDLDGVRRWLSAYASGARRSKGARTAKELSADADEFATGSREIGDNYASRRVYVVEGELTEAERNLVRAVSRINAATGGKLQIRFFDGVHADAYGFIEGDVIHVNRQGAQALLTTFGHEFTHWLEGNANYAAMRDFVLKPGGACELIFTEMFGRSFAEHKARIKASYKARGHELTDEQADAELLADACGATLFTRNFDALTEIRRANKGFFGKLLDFLKRLVNAVRGTKFEREVSEAVELYRKAAFEARRAEGTETKTETETKTAGTETAGKREEGTRETERTEGTEGGTQEAKPQTEENPAEKPKAESGSAASPKETKNPSRHEGEQSANPEKGGTGTARAGTDARDGAENGSEVKPIFDEKGKVPREKFSRASGNFFLGAAFSSE